MNTKATISIAIATFNEEKFIKHCLESVNNWVDEIILVDGNSTDKTIDLAKKFSKVKIIKTTNKPIFHLNKQIAIDACTSDWIFQLDADEIISSNLKLEILQILSIPVDQDPTNGYWIKRSNLFLGTFLKKGGQYPDPTLRLYKRGFGHLPCLSVHEQAIVKGSIGHLQNDLLHFADASFTRYLERNNRYTSLMADDLIKNNFSCNFVNFINYFYIKPLFWFLKTYFRHRGYMDGFPGFIFSLFSALRFPISYIKVYEKLQNN